MKSQSEVITAILIILLVLAAVVVVWQMVKVTIENSFIVQNITKTECHEDTIKFDDSQKEVSKTIITKQFAMAGLEELSKDYLTAYFSNMEELSKLNKNYDCGYSLIGAYKDIGVLREFCPSVYNLVENNSPLIFYDVEINKIDGEGIRVYNENIKNLRYDINNITVSLDIIKNLLSFEKEQKCEKKEVEEIEYLGTENKSVEVCNCGFTRCYSNGECGGQFAGIGGFDRETPVDKCNQKLEEIEKENSKDKTIVSFSALCDNNHFKDILIEVNKSISKKDITRDWLDDYNCKCIVDGEECDIVEDKNSIISSDGCFVTKDFKCLRYKCGDYEVIMR